MSDLQRNPAKTYERTGNPNMQRLYEDRVVRPECRSVEQVAAELEQILQKQEKSENWSQILEVQRKRLELAATLCNGRTKKRA